MTLLFNYSPSPRVRDAITDLCLRAVQTGKRIAIFERPRDLRDMTKAELQTAKLGVGLERLEARCSVPELMFAFRLYEHMRASFVAAQAASSENAQAEIPDQISVSTEFTQDDLQHFLNSISPNSTRLQDFEGD